MGRGFPITPVDPSRIFSGFVFKAAARILERRRASSKPLLPVQALAEPELIRTAWAPPDLTLSMEIWTGAAFTRFWVKTPAATAGVSE